MLDRKIKNFPLDIFSVKDQGIDNWLNNDSDWPIKDEESIKIGRIIIDAYSDLVRETRNERIKALLISQNKLVMELSGIFHSLLVLERLKKNNLNPCFYDDTIFFSGIINKHNEIDGIYKRYQSKIMPSQKKGLKNRIKHILFWFYRKFISYFDSSEMIFSLNYKNHYYLTKFAKDKQKKIKFYPIDNYKRTANLIDSINTDTKEIRMKILQILINLGKSYQFEIPKFVLESLNNLIKTIFCETNYQIEFFYRKLTGQKPRIYFVPSLGHIDFRNFSIAAKIAGHKVIGASHGNSIGMFDLQLRAFIDLSIVDIFLVVTEQAARNYKNLHKKYMYGISDTKIYSVNSMYYDRLKNKHDKMKPPAKLKKIMVVEYPLTETRHNIYSFWPYQLQLMLKVGQFLNDKGIATIMKRHPDRLTESDGLYDNVYNEQLVEPFEDIFDQADAYFFMNITSTTFGFAMTTNRPIFIFSTWLDEVWEDMVPLLCKRCITIPSWIDSEGKLCFDENYFNDMLKSESIWKINYDAVTAFNIPQSINAIT